MGFIFLGKYWFIFSDAKSPFIFFFFSFPFLKGKEFEKQVSLVINLQTHVENLLCRQLVNIIEEEGEIHNKKVGPLLVYNLVGEMRLTNIKC